MNKFGMPLLGLVGLALSGGGVAFAQQATPTAEVSCDLATSGEGSYLKVEGKAANLPDGTKLHVRLVAAKSGVEGAFFMTPVTGERFLANRVFARKKLAPLPYRVTVELILPDQRRAIAEYIRREWGLPSGARVILSTKEIDIGTVEEQAAFRVDAIKTLLELTVKAETCCNLVKDILNKPAPEKAEQRTQLRALGKTVRGDFIEPFDIFRMQFVVLHEQPTVDRLLSIMTGLSDPIQLHWSGQTARAQGQLEGHLAVLRRTKEELTSRLPKKKSQGDDEPEQGSK